MANYGKGKNAKIMQGKVLIIAGSDPSGGAGLQADIKTVTALGGYAAACVTALTVQNTLGVKAVHGVAPEIIHDQIRSVLEDIGADVIKIGMVGSAPAAEAIADALSAYRDIPIILDPVLAATSGDALAGDGLVESLIARLIPISHLVTPNADEAAALMGGAVNNEQAAARAGAALVSFGAKAALVKGGHLQGADVIDLLTVQTDEGVRAHAFSNPRLNIKEMHGTGCTLASAIAAGISEGMPIIEACDRAIRYVRAAIKAAPGLGQGASPLNHYFNSSFS